MKGTVPLGSFEKLPTSPMHQRLAELSQYLDTQRAALLAAAASLPRETWQQPPAPDRWSVSQILEHLYLVERGTSAMLATRIAAARASGHPPETETSSVLGSLDQIGVSDRSRPLAAPEAMIPLANPDRETAERQLAESRAALRSALASGDGLALGSMKQANRFGNLDLYQWILFLAEHERRHRAQIAEAAAQHAAVS